MKQHERRDHYQELTDRIVAELDKGIIPWQRPWNPDLCAGPQAPFNAVTGRHYHGINVISLLLHPAAFVSGDPRFCTYDQAQKAGWQVDKGQHGTTIFWTGKVVSKPGERNDGEEVDHEERPAIRMLRAFKTFTVFHVSQLKGDIPPYRPPTIEEAPWARPESIMTIVSNAGICLRTGGDRAFYSPNTTPDFIQLPPDHSFDSKHAWAGTAAHEIIHWTGGKDRLNRDMSGGFGSPKYGSEELIAELGAVFTCGMLNLPVDTRDSAAYLGHWRDRLKADNKAIFKAAAEAQKASDLTLSYIPELAAKLDPEPQPATLDHVLPASALPRPAAAQPA